MSIINILKQHGLLDWHVLLIGLEKKWSKKEDLIAYAETAIRQSAGEIDEDLVTLASGEEISEEELLSIGLHFITSHGQPLLNDNRQEVLEKWRFGCIAHLLKGGGSDDEKISELQEIYSQFGFPGDMASCSIYSDDEMDPLAAASIVADELLKRYQ